MPWQGPGQGIPNAPPILATLMSKNIDKPNYHKRTGQALALAYYYTGDKELKRRMEDHVANGQLPGTTWGHMSQWVMDKKYGRDNSPEAITDLQCTRVSKDGIIFEWTAPKAYGKSGKAARYFLKFSRKPIVKWALVNNPDVPEDPWQDKNLHIYKPECWHPVFLKKDAWWMGTHVEM